MPKNRSKRRRVVKQKKQISKKKSSAAGGQEYNNEQEVEKQELEPLIILKSMVIEPETGAVQETEVTITPVKGVVTLEDVENNLLDEERRMNRQQNEVLKLTDDKPITLPPPPHYTENNFTSLFGLMSCSDIRRHLEKTKLSDEDKVAFVEQNLKATKYLQKYVKGLKLNPEEFQATLEASNGVLFMLRGQIEELFGIMFDSYDLTDPDCAYLRELILNIKEKKKGTPWSNRINNIAWAANQSKDAGYTAAANAANAAIAANQNVALVAKLVNQNAAIAADYTKYGLNKAKDGFNYAKDGVVYAKDGLVYANRKIGEKILANVRNFQEHVVDPAAQKLKNHVENNNKALAELATAATNNLTFIATDIESKFANIKSTDWKTNIKNLFKVGFDVFKWVMANPIMAYIAIQQIQLLKEMLCERVGKFLGNLAGNNVMGSRDYLINILKKIYPDIKDPFKVRIQQKKNSYLQAATLVAKVLNQRLLAEGVYGEIAEIAVKAGFKMLPVALEMMTAGATGIPFVGGGVGAAIQGLSGVVVASSDLVSKQVKHAVNDVATIAAQNNCFKAFFDLFDFTTCTKFFRDNFVTELQGQKDIQDMEKLMRGDEDDDLLSEGALKDKDELMKEKIKAKQYEKEVYDERAKREKFERDEAIKRQQEEIADIEIIKNLPEKEKELYVLEKLRRQKVKQKEYDKKRRIMELNLLTPEEKRKRLDEYNDKKIEKIDRAINEDLRLKGLTSKQMRDEKSQKRKQQAADENAELANYLNDLDEKIKIADAEIRKNQDADANAKADKLNEFGDDEYDSGEQEQGEHIEYTEEEAKANEEANRKRYEERKNKQKQNVEDAPEQNRTKEDTTEQPLGEEKEEQNDKEDVPKQSRKKDASKQNPKEEDTAEQPRGEETEEQNHKEDVPKQSRKKDASDQKRKDEAAELKRIAEEEQKRIEYAEKQKRIEDEERKLIEEEERKRKDEEQKRFDAEEQRRKEDPEEKRKEIERLKKIRDKFEIRFQEHRNENRIAFRQFKQKVELMDTAELKERKVKNTEKERIKKEEYEKGETKGEPFSYLFSITNLEIINDELKSRNLMKKGVQEESERLAYIDKVLKQRLQDDKNEGRLTLQGWAKLKSSGQLKKEIQHFKQLTEEYRNDIETDEEYISNHFDKYIQYASRLEVYNEELKARNMSRGSKKGGSKKRFKTKTCRKKHSKQTKRKNKKLN